MPAAVSVAHTTSPDIDDDDELTGEQIDLLLAQATERLHAKAQSTLTTLPKPVHVRLPKLDAGAKGQPDDVVNGQSTRGIYAQEQDKAEAYGIRKVEDPIATKAMIKEKQKATAGPMWYNLPKTNLTPELKRDLQLLKMRNVLDPHRHYKKENGKMLVPEYSMMGTIQEGATEYFSGRIDNKKRKRTFVETVLAGEQENGRFKKKYGDVQAQKTQGKKAFYKGVQARRKSGVKKGG